MKARSCQGQARQSNARQPQPKKNKKMKKKRKKKKKNGGVYTRARVRETVHLT